MQLEQKIMEQLKDAMKSKNEAALRSLRAIKAEILKAKTEPGFSGNISEEASIKMLQKMTKQRRDALEIYIQQNRTDLAQKEQEEIQVIETFLPKQLDITELRSMLQQIIADTGATGQADMGKIMGIATKQFAGKADGKTISALVKELLTNTQ